jgi:ribosomal protein L3 glutamine methyltransferase
MSLPALPNIKQALTWVEQQFKASDLYYGHGSDSPWDEAVFLVLHTAKLPLTSGEEVLDVALNQEQQQKIIELTAKRVHDRIPLPYLLHEAWFCGLQFYVDERVLIPRSPIAEVIDAQFAPWMQPNKIRKALDLCTGSGCLAIAMAYALPQTIVHATDISEDALAVAKINVNAHQLDKRVKLIQSDLYQGLEGETYDLIVSNPPYVDAEDMAALPEEYGHEPELALAAGEDGLSLVRTILREAPHHLNPNGVLICEVGNSQLALTEQYPDVPFTWLEFQHGEAEVFLLTYDQLVDCHGLF